MWSRHAGGNVSAEQCEQDATDITHDEKRRVASEQLDYRWPATPAIHSQESDSDGDRKQNRAENVYS